MATAQRSSSAAPQTAHAKDNSDPGEPNAPKDALKSTTAPRLETEQSPSDKDNDGAQNKAQGVQDSVYLDCLSYFCRTYSIPYDGQKAVSGLPMAQTGLSPDLFIQAAQNLGLRSSIRQEQISKSSALFAPFIAFDEFSHPFIVERFNRSGKKARIVHINGADRLAKWVTVRDLERSSQPFIVLVAPAEAETEDDLAPDGQANLIANRVLADIFLKYWPSWVVVVLAAACINLLGLATPLFIMSVYDRVMPNLAIPTLWALTAGVVIALVFDLTLKQLRGMLLDKTGHRIDMRIGAHLFSHILSIRLDHLPAGSGGLANTVREFDNVRDFFTSATLVAATDFLFIGVFLGVLWLIAGPIILVPAVALVLILVFTLLFRLPIARATNASIGNVAKRQSLLVESLTGMEAIRTSNAIGKKRHALEQSMVGAARNTSLAKFWASLSQNFTGFTLQAVTIIVIVWGVYLVLEGNLSVGGLIAANILAGRALSPVSNIAQTLGRSGQAIQSLRRVATLLKMPTEDQQTVSSLQVKAGDIQAKAMGFSYPGAPSPSLKDLTISIKPGARLAIVGAIGSGKSTLGKLLCGLYDPTEGQLLLDSVDIRQFPRATLRSAIAYYAQDPILFTGTIRENIALGSVRANESDLEDAARVAGVLDFTNTLQLGIDTMIEERGRNLSGGQRQAIALARVLLAKPKVLFLDEPTSAMDGKSEAAFVERLRDYCGPEMTLIIATHKASLLDLAEELLVLENGQVFAVGPKAHVLKKIQAQVSGVKGPRPVSQTLKKTGIDGARHDP